MMRKRTVSAAAIAEMIDWRQAERFARQNPLRVDPTRWRLEPTARGVRLQLLQADPASMREALLEAGTALGYMLSTLHLQGYVPELVLWPEPSARDWVAQVEIAAAPVAKDPAELQLELIQRLEAATRQNSVWMRVLSAPHGAHWSGRPMHAKLHPSDNVLVLYTDADTEMDWLASGLATARIYLSADLDGVAVSVLESAFQNLKLRRQLHEMIGRTNYPQVVLQLGQLVGLAASEKLHKADKSSLTLTSNRQLSGVHHEKV